MHRFEVTLKTQQWNLILSIASIFIIPLILITTFKPVTNLKLFFNLALIIFFFIQIYELIVYFMYGQSRLIVEINKNVIQFYNLNEAGESYNVSSNLNLSDYDKFYIVKTTEKKYYTSNYKIEFRLKHTKNIITVYHFPSLWEPAHHDIDAISDFIGTLGKINDRDTDFWAMFKK